MNTANFTLKRAASEKALVLASVNSKFFSREKQLYDVAWYALWLKQLQQPMTRQRSAWRARELRWAKETKKYLNDYLKRGW